MAIKTVSELKGEMAVEHLVKRFESEKKRKKDIAVPINSIRINENLNFESPTVGEFKMSEQGFKQLCQQAYDFNLPYDYLMKMYEKDKDYFKHVINYHLQQGKDSERILRGIEDEDGELSVRGIVSNKYTPFDNLDALETFMRAMKLRGIDNYQIKTSSVREDGMFLRFVLPSTGVNFGTSYEGKEDWNYISIDLTNGEVANSALKVVSSVYRMVCTNGMVALDKVDGLNQRHSGSSDIAHNMKMSIDNGIVVGEKNLQELLVAKGITVDQPYEMIGKYAKQAKLSETVTKIVRENYDIEADRNLMSIVNAFTRTARDFESIDKRVELERFASRVLMNELKRTA